MKICMETVTGKVYEMTPTVMLPDARIFTRRLTGLSDVSFEPRYVVTDNDRYLLTKHIVAVWDEVDT